MVFLSTSSGPPLPLKTEKDVQPKRRRKRKRRAKARSQVTISNTLSSDLPATEPSIDDQSKPPKSCLQHNPDEDPVVDLTVCSDINYEVREGVHGVTYCCEAEDESREAKWTPVVAKKRKRKYAPVPDFIHRRFPPDHPIHRRNASSDSDTDSGSEYDLSTIIPSKSANVQYKEVDGTPGLSIWTNRTRS